MKFSVGDATYWYEVHGSGEPIVLLHGFTGSTKTWAPFVTDWENDFQIITIDLPGHGRTQIDTPRSMEACCEDLSQLFEHLSLHSFHLIGYSMGGRTALSFAMLYPNYINSLILESSSPGLEMEEDRHKRQVNDETLAQRIEKEGVASFVKFWENIPLFETQKKLDEHIQRSIREERLAQSKEGLASSLRFMGTGSQPNWWGKLNTLKQPVLLIVGELDEKFVRMNQRMRESLPNSQLIVVNNAGHAIHVEQPEIFGKIVKEFIFDR
ncbi:2-succinyl-6-hydroxy-2,4-cyclohexadiene-1-carboxylate synthase [Oceanobacillus limi]|uniref:Putative 2-succinyl-6-hydroxy-2,4-cyclohexadiene-1-carboxylate synthase n=1 Tax=Oceanobacillus limi TaxID=930131 RepID=A0A1I0DLW2_9BACI|nr:2-succinyl-6-hydroxy-2,4-cyclohexadiene-1-carboxylate synthase [Oceanobacillus limi]SET33495.1 2-succinyl-6-hydroxy-2,4-cyclohexadiene-1-carboxylate synthase [Oceanobacillus limi]